jgi:hypothetical protein
VVGGLFSYRGRNVLINASLPNILIYYMSMFLLPKTVIKRMDKMRRIFFGGVEALRGNIIM